MYRYFQCYSQKWQVFYIKSTTDKDGYIQIPIPNAAYEIESLNIEIEPIITDEGHFTETNYPLQMKPNFLTLGSIIEISEQGPMVAFVPNDSIRDL